MSRTFNDMTPKEKHEYTVWSQILADHTNSKTQHAEAKQNMDRLEYKGVGEDLRHQIDDLKIAIEALKISEPANRTDAEPLTTRMSKTMRERFSAIDARLDMLGEKVQGVGSTDIARYIREEIKTQIGLAAVQAVANAVTEVMGDKDVPDPLVPSPQPPTIDPSPKDPDVG